jgi:hypothetical protein
MLKNIRSTPVIRAEFPQRVGRVVVAVNQCAHPFTAAS